LLAIDFLKSSVQFFPPLRPNECSLYRSLAQLPASTLSSPGLSFSFLLVGGRSELFLSFAGHMKTLILHSTIPRTTSQFTLITYFTDSLFPVSRLRSLQYSPVLSTFPSLPLPTDRLPPSFVPKTRARSDFLGFVVCYPIFPLQFSSRPSSR